MNRIDEIKEVHESVKRIKLMSGMSGVIDLIDELMSEAERLTAERDEWKRRAEAADKCIYDMETYMELGSPKYMAKILVGYLARWRGPCAESANPSEIPTP